MLQLIIALVSLAAVTVSLAPCPPRGACLPDCHRRDGQTTCSQAFAFSGPQADSCIDNPATGQSICQYLYLDSGRQLPCRNASADCPKRLEGAPCGLEPSGGGEWCVEAGARCQLSQAQARQCRPGWLQRPKPSAREVHVIKAAPYRPPPRQLPTIDGSSFPGWQAVFTAGECDADDRGTPGYGPHGIPGADGGVINLNKRCYSCFRIPSLAVNLVTGTLHAFAEARRGEVDGSHCPDIPDARLAYKRSVDGGASWSPLRILEEVEGRCRSQPTPVYDNATGGLLLGFNDNCNDFERGNPTTPHLTRSADDGLTWSNATPMATGSGVLGKDVVLGLSRGLALYDSDLPSKTRLIMPAETGTLYSDDHGASWTAVPDRLIGEHAIARCTPGACTGAPGGTARFAMAIRNGPRGSEQVMIRFSNDSLHWSRPEPLPDIAPYSNYSQAPGLIATPGGLILSHGGKGGLTGHGDGNGCDLFKSVDGLHWKLWKHIWPFQTGVLWLRSD